MIIIRVVTFTYYCYCYYDYIANIKLFGEKT